MIRLKLIAVITVFAATVAASWAADVVKITIPRHSELTPVQRLNREGVDAVKKHQYEKATALFYKAYLYDPADPFTLNNLGYVSELHGELEHAQKFYALASMQSSNANIDQSNVKMLVGKPMQSAFENLQDGAMRVNRMNVDALTLLSQNRGLEAVALLRKAQVADPQNPFTLNNLGVAYEAIGEYESGLKAYEEAASLNSSDPATLTLDRQWSGKKVSMLAAASAGRLDERIRKMGSSQTDALTLTARGVLAANENNWLAARQDFLHAYSLNPTSAFALNNRGYVAEMDGDLETAQFFYQKARKAGDAEGRVGVATQHVAEGKKLASVAVESDHHVDDELEKYSQQRHKETGPIELTPRGDNAVPPGTPSSSDIPLATQPSATQIQ